MIPLSPQTLALCCDCTMPRAENWAPALNEAMAACEINTGPRVAAFLAQIAHESGRLQYVRELWGPTRAQEGYEGRTDLGNTQPGDGFRFRGRGLVQVTGRANYASARDSLRRRLGDDAGVPDFVAEPQLLEAPHWAALSAADYWQRRGLNELADQQEFERITRRINGGLNGYSDRLELWAGARAALGLEPAP
jgi:putative chitinase